MKVDESLIDGRDLVDSVVTADKRNVVLIPNPTGVDNNKHNVSCLTINRSDGFCRSFPLNAAGSPSSSEQENFKPGGGVMFMDPLYECLWTFDVEGQKLINFMPCVAEFVQRNQNYNGHLLNNPDEDLLQNTIIHPDLALPLTKGSAYE